jgi:hypothetical protein
MDRGLRVDIYKRLLTLGQAMETQGRTAERLASAVTADMGLDAVLGDEVCEVSKMAQNVVNCLSADGAQP